MKYMTVNFFFIVNFHGWICAFQEHYWVNRTPRVSAICVRLSI